LLILRGSHTSPEIAKKNPPAVGGDSTCRRVSGILEEEGMGGSDTISGGRYTSRSKNGQEGKGLLKAPETSGKTRGRVTSAEETEKKLVSIKSLQEESTR